MEKYKNKFISLLHWSEKYTKTDMVYLTKNSFWINANTVITSIFAFAISIAFARLLPKDIYGTYQFVISISAIIGSFTLTGMNTAVTQAVARGFEKVFPESVRTQIKFGMIPAILGLGFSLYYILNQNSVLSISLIAVAILLPIANALNTWGAFLSGKKEFKDYFKYSQIINIIYYGGTTLVILFLPKALFLILANFILNTIANFVVYKLIIKKHKPNDNNEEEALSFGKKFSLSNILPMIALNIDNIVIFHFLGATNLAIYAFASNIPDRLGGLLRPISMVAFPKLAEQEPSDIKANIFKKTSLLFVISLAAGLFYILIAPFIFKTFFPFYIESVKYSQLYSLAIILGVTSGLPMIAMYARRINKVHILNISYPIISIAMLCFGGYLWGIIGVIFAKIASNLLLLGGSLCINKFSD